VYQRTFGEKGAGPGQFGNMIGPCLEGPGDSLFIPDLQNNRFNRFARDGSFGGSFMVNIMEGLGRMSRRGGRLVGRFQVSGFRFQVSPGEPGTSNLEPGI
jgi:hypothetical protein